MTEIEQTQFAAWLKAHPLPSSGLWLIHGEELLREHALDRLVRGLLPDGSGSSGYEPVYDDGSGLGLALEKVRTVPLLGDAKVVVLRDARLFDSGEDRQKLLNKIKSAVTEDEMDKAVRALVRLLALVELDYDQLADRVLLEEILDLSAAEDYQWLLAAAVHAKKMKVPIVKAHSGFELVTTALERPFPSGNHLVLSTERVDRRRKDYKAIAAKAVVVDCSVPQGSRAVDKKAQVGVLKQCARDLLAQHGKKMAVPAFDALSDKTGFKLRVFVSALETLIEFVGERAEIGIKDVEAVLTRTRQDPVYTFTEALAQRHLQQALFYLKSLLSEQLNPLQLLAAMINQVRKLIVARDFLDDPLGRGWRPGLPYAAFRQEVMPDIVDFDRALSALLQSWHKEWAGDAAVKSGKTKKDPKIKSDILLAPNPANAYPVYLLLQRAALFTSAELAFILSDLHRVDATLKSAGRNPEAVLTRAVLGICKPTVASGHTAIRYTPPPGG